MFTLKVVPDDGEPFEIETTSRDIVAWESGGTRQNPRSIGSLSDDRHHGPGLVCRRPARPDRAGHPGVAEGRGHRHHLEARRRRGGGGRGGPGPYPDGSLNRLIVALAIRSGIPAQQWRTGDPKDLDTALVLMRNQQRTEREEG
jgi:hypothetical protein